MAKPIPTRLGVGCDLYDGATFGIWRVHLDDPSVIWEQKHLYPPLGKNYGEFWGMAARALAVSPDGRVAVTSHGDKSLLSFDTATGSVHHKFVGHSRYPLACVFAGDGEEIVSGGQDKTLCLWKASSGELRKSCAGKLDAVWLETADDDRLVVAASRNVGKVCIFDRISGELVRTLKAHARSTVSVLAKLPDGRHFITAGLDKAVRIWDAKAGKLVDEIAFDSADPRLMHNPISIGVAGRDLYIGIEGMPAVFRLSLSI